MEALKEKIEVALEEVMEIITIDKRPDSVASLSRRSIGRAMENHSTRTKTNLISTAERIAISAEIKERRMMMMMICIHTMGMEIVIQLQMRKTLEIFKSSITRLQSLMETELKLQAKIV